MSIQARTIPRTHQLVEAVLRLRSELSALRSEHKELRARIDSLDAEKRTVEEELARHMEEELGRTQLRAAGHLFQSMDRASWKRVPERKQELMEAARRFAPELIDESPRISAPALSAFMNRIGERSRQAQRAFEVCVRRSKVTRLRVVVAL